MELEGKNAELEGENAELKKENAELKMENAELKMESAGLQEENAALEGNVSNLNDRYEDFFEYLLGASRQPDDVVVAAEVE